MRKSSLFILGFFLFFLSTLAVLVWASNRYDNWAQVRVSSFYTPSEANHLALANPDWVYDVVPEILGACEGFSFFCLQLLLKTCIVVTSWSVKTSFGATNRCRYTNF